jgi:acetoin utilization deacetylase AcuC-like enzyme/GNAT superfamily N-acetyltransferase
MLRIRKLQDTTSPANREAIAQVQAILLAQFPLAKAADLAKIPKQLEDPLTHGYRSVLWVADTPLGQVRGFAMMLHLPDVDAALLEYVSTAPGTHSGGGLGGALYETVRDEARSLGVAGLFFECLVDDAALISDAAALKQNVARLRFYERYGARPLLNNNYAEPGHTGDENVYYLMLDPLDRPAELPRQQVQSVVRALLQRKYAALMSAAEIKACVASFTDPVSQLRAPRYRAKSVATRRPSRPGIALLVNDGHDIHHVRDRGYVEAPVRIAVILDELDKTGLFRRLTPRHAPDALVHAVHAKPMVEYLRSASAKLPPGKSIYPVVFPVRNWQRPPKDIEAQVGYYGTDTFTPLNRNVWPAARGAVDCAVTAAQSLFEGFELAYALVRPPGHHAESRVYGGFCYLNNAAVAAHYLSRFGRVAMLDLDYHHGNGQQDIFYTRDDVFTVSVHGAPPAAYPYCAGFADERGEGAGQGYNLNLPLPDRITAERYRDTLAKALKAIRGFAPKYVVVALGLDTAQADPTGSWPLKAPDFAANGALLGAMGLPTLVVQEGGYRTRTLGINARNFFEGLWRTHPAGAAADDAQSTPASRA